jgi:outer membrane protein assembly factor BamD
MVERNILCLAAALIAFVTACSTSHIPPKQRTVEEIFADALKSYENTDWTEAASGFDIIKLQYPASQYADDAQYYLAEINRQRGEYVMAAYNYSVVRRSFPTSEWAKPSAFKIGQCYEDMALPPDRDQEYIKKAIQAYTEFQQIYPTDSLALQALERIRELRNKLAERYMIIAEHYVKTNSRKAAIVYYDAVIDEYPDTQHFEPAIVEKIRLQYMLGQIAECRTTIAFYRRSVRNPTMAATVNTIEKDLP